ncbi:hypothetical protein O6H91_11G098500 [Diphasiastrum complanatum]|uniref:Uncharacterized protein n=1 Tax=Diphasiastrum complanatum TaxID=34168 RepID=A0ACC2CC02_DIPCM|nr:hypothetical protein O6H91_11G098500 [Diphasiastrum complanatum]
MLLLSFTKRLCAHPLQTLLLCFCFLLRNSFCPFSICEKLGDARGLMLLSAISVSTCGDPFMSGEGEDPASTSSSFPENGEVLRGPEKGRSCAGCLYFSSQRRDGGRDPICVGLSRPENRVYSMMSESEREDLKDGRRLLDFKYACVGYSVYKQNTTTSAYRQEGHAELPACLGMEFLGIRKDTQGASSPTIEVQDPDEGPPMLPRPPSAARPPTIGGIKSDEFLTRIYGVSGLFEVLA